MCVKARQTGQRVVVINMRLGNRIPTIMASSTCCRMYLNYLGTLFLGMAFRFRERIKIHYRVSTYSIKLQFGHFTWLFCRVQQRNQPEVITHFLIAIGSFYLFISM